jgi:hypothetical protein
MFDIGQNQVNIRLLFERQKRQSAVTRKYKLVSTVLNGMAKMLSKEGFQIGFIIYQQYFWSSSIGLSKGKRSFVDESIFGNSGSLVRRKRRDKVLKDWRSETASFV